MTFLRILAVASLALVSLLNAGYPFGTDPKPDIVLAIAVAALGLAGFVAAFGLARNTCWGMPAALAVAGINVVAAIIALVSDTEGAIVGLVLSAFALLLAFATGPGTRKVAVA